MEFSQIIQEQFNSFLQRLDELFLCEYARGESIRGEYWIDDSGEPWYADGDFSDKNHEMIIIDLVVGEILNSLNVHTGYMDDGLGSLKYFIDKIYEENKEEFTPEQQELWEDGDYDDVLFQLLSFTEKNEQQLKENKLAGKQNTDHVCPLYMAMFVNKK